MERAFKEAIAESIVNALDHDTGDFELDEEILDCMVTAKGWCEYDDDYDYEDNSYYRSNITCNVNDITIMVCNEIKEEYEPIGIENNEINAIQYEVECLLAV